MRWGQAERLARVACRRRADGTLTPKAARAWERLSAQSDDPDVWALKTAWLTDPHEDTWPYVEPWLTPADVLAAAVDPARSVASRAAIGAYCARAGLVPKYEADRVVFFVMTGDQERYRAADPNGTVLARAYRHASERTREALRRTVVGAGDLDLVRVITERTSARITAAEAGYLARQLAAAGEWARLWRALPAMRLTDAAHAARLFAGWEPDSEAGRVFLARLAAIDPDALAAPAAAATTLIKTSHVNELSFAPDGSEVAVRHPRGTKLFTLPGGQLLGNYATRDQLQMLALGDGTIVYKGDPRAGYPLVRRAPGREPETLLADASGADIGRTPDGFVVVKGRTAYFGSATGPWSRTAVVALPTFSDAAMVSLVAADAASGHLAFRVHDGDRRDLVLVDADLQVLASTPEDGPVTGAFSGPERIVLWGWGEGRTADLWRRDGTALVRAATVALAGYTSPVVGPGVLVNRGLGGMEWFDADTLTRVAGPPGFPPDRRKVALSPDGSLVAAAVGGGVEVHDLWLHRLPELPGWRLTSAVPADLDTVALLEKRRLDPPVADAVALLRAALAYRFGAEVALGDGTRVDCDPHDIALGGG